MTKSVKMTQNDQNASSTKRSGSRVAYLKVIPLEASFSGASDDAIDKLHVVQKGPKWASTNTGKNENRNCHRRGCRGQNRNQREKLHLEKQILKNLKNPPK